MRLYGKKFLKNRMQRETDRRIETRDAILWDTLPAQRLCRVKIQGTNQLVIAHYPENWEQTPSWLKPGNAIRIIHMGGQRGRIEVIGHGQMVPTPVSGTILPTPATPQNGVLTGCLIRAVPNDPQMTVQVTTGAYRIGGAEYTLDAVPMLYGDNFSLGDGGAMEVVAGVVVLNAVPAAGYFRYDLISIGADGVIDYAAGTAATSNPVKPDPAASHIALGYILVHSGMTKVLNSDINKEWTVPEPSSVTVVPADSDLTWGQGPVDVVVSALDQYGNAITATGYGWYMILEFLQGNGTIASAEEGSSTTSIGGHAGATNHYHFTYTRDNLATDVSPVLKGTCEIDSPISGLAHIILRDGSGNPM